MNETVKLMETLRNIQEPKGYYFNRDKLKTLELLDGLMENKRRYGYMSCPCRLSLGERETDKDIVCPCVYREADVKEYGSCYCNLYVSKAWNEDRIPHEYVPERRPAEKIL